MRLERDGAIAEIVLARPDKQNAMSRGMWRRLQELCGELDADEGVRVVILRGEPPAFSAGADIGEFEEVFADRAAASAYNDLVQAALAGLERLGKPTLAQVAGNCVGGGCAMAVACDLRFATPGARFGITPARLGLGFALPDVKRVVDLVGPAPAKDILFSGRLLDTAEAFRIGLVDRVAPEDELAAAVRAYAATLIAASGNSQRLIKRMMRLVLDGVAHETEATRDLRDSAVEHADFREGYRAFLEKRRPRFG